MCLSIVISWPTSNSFSTYSSLPEWIVSNLPVLGGFFSHCGVNLSLHPEAALALAVFVIYLRTLVWSSGQCTQKSINLAGQQWWYSYLHCKSFPILLLWFYCWFGSLNIFHAMNPCPGLPLSSKNVVPCLADFTKSFPSLPSSFYFLFLLFFFYWCRVFVPSN